MNRTNNPFVRVLAIVLTLAMMASVLPVNALATGSVKETPMDETVSLTSTDVSEQLTDEERLQIFEENMDTDKVSEADFPAADEEVRVIVELDVQSLLDVREDAQMENVSMNDFLSTDSAKAQLEKIQDLQADVLAEMKAAGISQEVTYTYSAVTGGFAAKVAYGDIAAIEEIDGVRKVSLCETYYPDVVGEASLGEALTEAEVAAYANDTEYQGEGMLVGIIDTGLDYSHEAFANAPEVQKLTRDSLESLVKYTETEDGYTFYSYAALWYAQANSKTELVTLTADDLYKSAKVPFGFDYADYDPDIIPSATAVDKYGNDHGTHVAGIAAGKTVDEEGNVTFAGQSPEAQLAIFKVFSDSSSGASTDTLLAALNDAILLGVDVINMSLGSSGGFSAEEEGSVINTYYDAVKAYGIILNCSGGNAYSSSYGGAQGDFTSTSDPDTGINGSPGSYDASLAVASINASQTSSFAVGEQNVPYNDVSGYDFAALLLGENESATYEYVMVPGYGEASDYEGLDVTGKIAVVIRGNLSFNDKQLNAAAAGAAGCIIYNNRDGYLLNMAVDNYAVPTVCISYANGLMMGEQENKTLTVSASTQGAVTMSDFSSWGPLPSLELKPEITAPGGSIYSSLPFGQYGYMSGTSMASPYMAGTSAAALQYVNKMFPSLSISERRALVNELLMSTADIVYDESGVAYSPRRQGSGLVDLAAAVSTPAYLYVKGSDKAKIELGDDSAKSGVYDLAFQVKNLTSVEMSYNINTLVQTESVTSDGQYIAQAGYELDAETEIFVTGGAVESNVLTVPANGEVSVVVTVTLSEEAKAYMDANFENGIYVEGFVELTNDNDPSLSIPYLAFYGDWTQAPIFEDADYYNDEDVKMYATTPAGVYGMMYVFPLGIYPFTVPEGYEEPAASKDLISINLGSGNGISNLYYLQAGMLRGAGNVDVTITDADTGDVINTMPSSYIRKAYYNSSTGTIRPGYVGNIWPELMGYASIPSGTRMTYTATAYLDYDGAQKNKNNAYSFNLTADSEYPYVVNRNDLKFYYGKDGRVYLDVILADNFALAGATLYSATTGYDSYGRPTGSTMASENYYSGIMPILKDDGSVYRNYEEVTITFDVTNFYKDLFEGTFYILAYDYALNECCLRVTLDEIPVTGLTLDTTEVTLPTRGYVQLNTTVTPDNATNQALTWTSSDTSVAEVKAGLVKAIAPGTATITVTASAYTDISATCTVTVTEEMGPEVPMEEILLSYKGISLNVGDVNERLYLAAYSPYTATNYDLTWSSSDESIATVDENGHITGVSAGTCVVTATAVLGDASASATVTVNELTSEVAGSFVINGDILVSYSGSEETVTVPEGIRVIGEKAFNNNDAIKHVVLPNSVEVIEARAFYDCSYLETINLPETMVSIGERAFYSCKKLTSLGLDNKGVIPKGLTEIPTYAFYACNALEGDLVIPDTVTTIGANAFASCYELDTLTMADTLTTMDEGGYQFNNCKGLTSINLSAGLTELPKSCFSSCQSLTELPDLKNITVLGNSCFQHLDGAIEITVPASVTYVGNNCFGYADLVEKIHFEGDPELGTGVCSYDVALTTVTGNLTKIGETMFRNCTAMTEFIVPDNVNYIGKNAFQASTALKSIIFTASFQGSDLSMGLTPFNGCKAFSGIIIEDGCTALKVVDNMLLSGDGKKLIQMPTTFADTTFTVPEGIEVIGSYAFYGNKTLKTVVFPESLQDIEEYAFYNCTALTAIDLPDGITTVGSYAFYGCTAVTDLDLGKCLQSVEPYAFRDLKKVTSIILPGTVKTIGDYAFYACNVATTINIPEGVTSIGAYAFNGCKKVEQIILPSTLTEMGKYAFYDCNAATVINTGGLTVIPERAFYNCKAVTSVTMSDDVTAINPYAFYYCWELSEVNIPSSLENIGNYAFNMCRKIPSLDLSNTKLVSIGNNAFYQCYAIESLVLPETLEAIGTQAFGYMNYTNYNPSAYVTEVHLPASVTSIASNAFNYANKLQAFTVDPGNSIYTAANGILLIKETGEFYIWPMANTTTEFTIPTNMTTIPAKMFQNNGSLKKVTIPGTVTYIGVSAFNGAKIEEIIFERPETELQIDSSAFANCEYLTSVELPYGTTALGSYVFNGCDRLESVNLPDTITYMGASSLAYCASLTDVHLPASLAELPNSTFANCPALEEITLPAGMSSIATTSISNGFSGCNSLKNIWVEEGSHYYKSVDGVLFDSSGKTLLLYPMGRTEESYQVPEGTVRINANAGRSNPYLKSLSFPSTLTRIGGTAFYGCSELKDIYFNSMTAPVLETTLSTYNGYYNFAYYGNFVGYWQTVDTTTGKVTPNDFGLNLYYPEGATGFDSYVWEIYFQSGTTNVMDASYFTVTGLTVTEAEGRTAQLTWDAVKKSGAETITYTVERANATHVVTDTQNTWMYEDFEVLADGITDTAYTDASALSFGMSYAYRVSAYNADGNTGPAAVATITIAVDETNPDEMAALAVIQAIEALKPIENLTLEDETKVQQVQVMYDALTDEQKALVSNIATLEEAFAWIDGLYAAQVEALIDALTDPANVDLNDADTIATARAAYEALTSAQKALVSNLDKLVACEEALAEMISVDAVEQLIKALPVSADVTLEDAEAIRNARAAYEALTDSEKSKVDELYLEKLISCETTLTALEDAATAAAVEAMIEALTAPEAVTFYDADAIAAARAAYEALSDNAKAQVTNISKLIACEEALKAREELPFTDVPENAWYVEAVKYAYQYGLVSGVTETTFGPYLDSNRAMLICILYRMAGSPEVADLNSFKDVSADAYYAKAIAWAKDIGLAYGNTDGTFRPKDTITRADLITLLYRYASLVENMDVSVPDDVLDDCTDLDDIPGYALEAFAWGVENGIVAGVTSDGLTLNPKGTAYRAQLVSMIYRFIQLSN